MKEKLLILSLLLTVCLPIAAQQASNKFVFTPQWTAHAQFAGYYVAKEKGFYKQAGIDVDIVHPSVSQTAMNRLQNRESQATTLQLCQAMEIIDNGISLVNILQTSMNNGTVIVSRRDKDPLTQRGARVGMWHAGFSQIPICMSIKEKLNYKWIRFTSNVDLFLKGKDTNQPLGLWECNAFNGEVIDDIRDKQLLLYTDGLNEAENQQQDRLGDDRIIELMSDTANLTSEEIINKLKEAVATHRSGAEPNDDLTLLCLKIKTV